MGVVGYDSNQEAAVDLSTKTPVEIDEQLFPLYAQRWQQVDRLIQQERHIAEHESGKYGWQPPIYVERAKAKLPEIQAKIDELNIEITPLADEYDRRRWNRFVVVPGGHIHKIWCGTLRPTTQRFWLTEASGMHNADVVGKYNYTACTKCFPDAPVVHQEVTDQPGVCSGTGSYVEADLRLYSPRGRCPVCNQRVSVTRPYGKVRKHLTPEATQAAKPVSEKDLVEPVKTSKGTVRTVVAARNELKSTLEWQANRIRWAKLRHVDLGPIDEAEFEADVRTLAIALSGKGFELDKAIAKWRKQIVKEQGVFAEVEGVTK